MLKKKAVIAVMLIMVMVFGLLPLSASAADRGAWAPNVSYALNDTAIYGGQTYKIIQPHTSLLGWEPPNVPALWQVTQAAVDTQIQALTAPANLSSTAVTSTSVTLAWTALISIWKMA